MTSDGKRFHGYDAKLRKLPPADPKPAGVSWWLAEDMQTNRAGFYAHVQEKQAARMNRSRFGGRGRNHDSGIPERDAK